MKLVQIQVLNPVLRIRITLQKFDFFHRKYIKKIDYAFSFEIIF